jgi:hypothetical protein
MAHPKRNRMMATRDVLTIAAACVVLAGGCRRSAAPEPSPSPAAAQDAPSAAADAPLAEAPPTVAVATPVPAGPPIAVRLNAGGVGVEGPSDQNAFVPGDTVTASVDASALPPGSIVKASWFDASGNARGEEHKTPSPGERWLTFTAPGVDQWPEGAYRVDMRVSTGGLGSAAFQIGQGALVPEQPGATPTLQPG